MMAWEQVGKAGTYVELGWSGFCALLFDFVIHFSSMSWGAYVELGRSGFCALLFDFVIHFSSISLSALSLSLGHFLCVYQARGNNYLSNSRRFFDVYVFVLNSPRTIFTYVYLYQLQEKFL